MPATGKLSSPVDRHEPGFGRMRSRPGRRGRRVRPDHSGQYRRTTPVIVCAEGSNLLDVAFGAAQRC